MTLTDKEERAMADYPENIAAQITHEDLAALTRWMTEGRFDVHDIADAVEDPWSWWDAIQALREGKAPEVEE